MSGRFDILLMTETKIDATFSNSQFNVEGFRMYRVNRNAHGGGLMIFIRNDICFHHAITRFNKDMSRFGTESMLLKVKINLGLLSSASTDPLISQKPVET